MIKKGMPVPKVTIRTVCFCSNKRHIGYCEIQEGSQWSAGAFEECINMKKKKAVTMFGELEIIQQCR